MSTSGRGLIIAAPASSSGKTTITLGLLRALKRRGLLINAAKSGPDYIDPRFHQAACGAPCVTLDAWAMSETRLTYLASTNGLRLIEGAMGLFDGAPPDGKGSVADLARILRVPVVLVVDASKTSQSIAALVSGFVNFDPQVKIAGVILNKVGSLRHERLLRHALKNTPVLGAIHRDPKLVTPSRHLGLIQAQELPELDAFLDYAADVVERSINLDTLEALGREIPVSFPRKTQHSSAKRIAVASDAAFDFTYTHFLHDIEFHGGQIETFSPLKNETVPQADVVYLPGGYPELYAEQLSNNSNFMDSLRMRAQDTEIYGECGGYMVLGETLTDANGLIHEMAGLLPLSTSFADRKLHLGYRSLRSDHGFIAGDFNGHEFHYATTLKADGDPLFRAQDAERFSLPDMGLRKGNVCGSFAHIIDRACSDDSFPIPLFS